MPTAITGDTGVDQIQAGATSGGLPVFQCRAWVNFDGTRDSTGAASTANTNRFIRASGNVASVLRNGAGDYTITFTTAMPDVNYVMAGSSGTDGTTAAQGRAVNTNTTSPSTSALRITVKTDSSGAIDDPLVYVTIFR